MLTHTLDQHLTLVADPDPPGSRHGREHTDRHLLRLAHTTDAAIITGNPDLLDAALTPPAITPQDLIERIRRP